MTRDWAIFDKGLTWHLCTTLQEGAVELGEEGEFTLRVALARIYQLYTVLDLARLDLYDPVKQLLDAQVSGLFPLQYEKVCLPARPRARF